MFISHNIANIFLVSHILLLFHLPKGSWNKSAKIFSGAGNIQETPGYKQKEDTFFKSVCWYDLTDCCITYEGISWYI